MGARAATTTPVRFSSRKFERLCAGKSNWRVSAFIQERTKAQIHPNTLGNLRNGKAQPTFVTVAAIMAAFDVSLDELSE